MAFAGEAAKPSKSAAAAAAEGGESPRKDVDRHEMSCAELRCAPFLNALRIHLRCHSLLSDISNCTALHCTALHFNSTQFPWLTAAPLSFELHSQLYVQYCDCTAFSILKWKKHSAQHSTTQHRSALHCKTLYFHFSLTSLISCPLERQIVDSSGLLDIYPQPSPCGTISESATTDVEAQISAETKADISPTPATPALVLTSAPLPSCFRLSLFSPLSSLFKEIRRWQSYLRNRRTSILMFRVMIHSMVALCQQTMLFHLTKGFSLKLHFLSVRLAFRHNLQAYQCPLLNVNLQHRIQG